MTLSTPTNRVDFDGTGTTGPFPFTFQVMALSHLVVTQKDSSGVVTSPSFTATGIGSPGGGNITLTSACPVGATLTIRRVVPITQDTSIRNQAAFFPEIHELEFDKLTMIDQQQEEALSRALVLPETVVPSGVTPAPSEGMVLGWVAGKFAWLAAATAGLAASLLSYARGYGADLVGYLAPHTGAVGRLLYLKLSDKISITDFGADPTGVTSSHTALVNFFNASTGKFCDLPAGTYKLTSEIAVTLTNCIFQGVPGQTKITGDFGYAIIRLLELNNVQFRDIIFETTYPNAVEDGGKSVVYSMQNNAANVVFSRCTFQGLSTAPYTNTSGLTFYTRITSTDNACTTDGLWIEDCIFKNLGRIGCTLMNRGLFADRYTAFRRVYFNRNKAINTGLGNLYGFILSLDHYGSDFQVDHNEGWNAYQALVENTGWINGSISYNKLMTSASVSRLLSLDGTDVVSAGSFKVGDTYVISVLGTTDFTLVGAASNTVGLTFVATGVGTGTGVAMHPMFMSGLTVIGNRSLVPTTGHSNCNYVKESYFANNLHWSNATDQAFLMRGCSDNRFSHDTYINANPTTGRYAVFVAGDDLACNRNIWDGSCIFDCSASAVGYSVVRVFQAGTGNIIQSGAQIKKGSSGEYFDQTGVATLNFAEDYSQAWTPVLAGLTTPGTPTYTVQSGTYTKVGKQVRFSGRVSISAIGGITGNLVIKGLPIAASGNTTWGETVSLQSSSITLAGLAAGSSFFYGTVAPNATQIVLIADGLTAGGAGGVNIAGGALSATTTFVVSGVYTID